MDQGKTITLKIKYSDFITQTRSTTKHVLMKLTLKNIHTHYHTKCQMERIFHENKLMV